MNKQLALGKAAVISFSVAALSLLAFSAQAIPVVLNGSFEFATSPGLLAGSPNFEIPNGVPDPYLQNWITANPAGTTGGGFLDCLIFAGSSAAVHACGGPAAFKLWKDPGLSPDRGNYIAFDGDSSVADSIFQTITDLVPGQLYNVSFWQAAGQLSDRTGDTTERWEVSLIGSSITESHLSFEMMNKSQDIVPWMSQTLSFRAHDATEVLRFFAVGTPDGLPPFVLLDGVSISAVPEPATLALLCLGMLGIFLARGNIKRRELAAPRF